MESAADINAQAHWDDVYARREPDRVSWYEPAAEASLELIEEAGLARDAAIVDVGGGASRLAGQLLDAGYTDVTVADVSARGLERARSALGERADQVSWVQADLRGHDFGRHFDLWHDRALFHFMVDPADRDAYLAVLDRTMAAGGHLVLATFGPQGPTQCSGLPVMRYDAGAIAAILGSEYTLLSSRLVEHRTPSGQPQQFMYAHLVRA